MLTCSLTCSFASSLLVALAYLCAHLHLTTATPDKRSTGISLRTGHRPPQAGEPRAGAADRRRAPRGVVLGRHLAAGLRGRVRGPRAAVAGEGRRRAHEGLRVARSADRGRVQRPRRGGLGLVEPQGRPRRGLGLRGLRKSPSRLPGRPQLHPDLQRPRIASGSTQDPPRAMHRPRVDPEASGPSVAVKTAVSTRPKSVETVGPWWNTGQEVDEPARRCGRSLPNIGRSRPRAWSEPAQLASKPALQQVGPAQM